MATHCSVLVWRIPWTEESRWPQSTGLQRVRHDWVTNIYSGLLEFSIGMEPTVVTGLIMHPLLAVFFFSASLSYNYTYVFWDQPKINYSHWNFYSGSASGGLDLRHKKRRKPQRGQFTQKGSESHQYVCKMVLLLRFDLSRQFEKSASLLGHQTGWPSKGEADVLSLWPHTSMATTIIFQEGDNKKIHIKLFIV